MQINLIKKVVGNIAGEPAVKIVDLLEGKKDVNEFLIAKKLGLTINQTRNLLYRLSHLGVLTSVRKKDKRKGWYIYFWTFNILRSLEVLAQTISKEIDILKIQLENKKKKRFYKCAVCGREAEEEAAMLTNFTCSECGEVYKLADNTAIINESIKQIEKLQKELSGIQAEIDIEENKKGKKLTKFLKSEEKKKKELRKKSAKIRAKLKKKLNKAADKLKQHRKDVRSKNKKSKK